MKKVNNVFFILILVMISFTSCKKDEEERDDNSSLLITENGTQVTTWVNTLHHVQEYDDGIYVIWQSWDENSDREIEIKLGTVTAQKYDLTTGLVDESYSDLEYAVGMWRFNVVEEETITITNVNKGNRTISGTFSFKINEEIQGETYNYDVSGEFKDFPY